ncbi:MAG: hypothetical protein GXP55_17675 [Deltaproteobacteria bacterium]|nr:hypothetical protein [Deltaproteobacteria bacterium]
MTNTTESEAEPATSDDSEKPATSPAAPKSRRALVAVALVVAGLALLVGDELFALNRADDALESGRAVVSVAAEQVDPSAEGRLVHVTGQLSTREILVDPVFQVSVSALRLLRHVEMYQWREERVERELREDGGTRRVSEPRYSGVWSATPIDSGDFEQEEGHENPDFPAEDDSFEASRPVVGAFAVPASLLAQVETLESLTPDAAAANAVELAGKRGQLWDDSIYVGQDPAQPRVGDLRVRFQRTPFTTVTVVGAQRGSELTTWTAPSGRELAPHLSLGREEAGDAASDITRVNTPLTWALRALSWLLIWLGLWLLLRRAMGSERFVRLGRMLEAGAIVPALALATPLCVLVVGGLWTAHRPVMGGLLLTLGAVVAIFGVWWVRRRLDRKSGQAPITRSDD